MPRLVGGVRMPAALVDLWRHSELVDVELIGAGGERMAAHRIILAGCSGLARKMLCGADTGGKKALVFAELDAEVLGALLEFIYVGECEVSDGKLPDLLRAAHILQVEALTDSASGALCSLLTPWNCLDVWLFAEQLGLSELARRSHRMALSHFAEVSGTASLLNLPHARLLELLEDDELNAPSEEAVYEAVERWTRAQSMAPSADVISKLLSTVRFALLPRDVIETRVAHETLFQPHACVWTSQLLDAMAHARLSRRLGDGPNTVCMPWFEVGDGVGVSRMGVYLIHASTGRVTEVPVNGCPAWQACPRGAASANTTSCVYWIGGTDDKACASRSVRCFDVLRSAPVGVALLPQPLCAASAALWRGRIYVIGGRGDAGMPLSHMFTYHVERDEWAVGRPLRAARMNHCVVALDGRLYALGGMMSGGRPCRSAETFDVAEDGPWRHLTHTLLARVDAAAAVLEGKIFLLGGCVPEEEDENVKECPPGLVLRPTNSVEVFEPVTGAWRFAPSMPEPAAGHAAVVIGGKIYVIMETIGAAHPSVVHGFGPALLSRSGAG